VNHPVYCALEQWFEKTFEIIVKTVKKMNIGVL